MIESASISLFEIPGRIEIGYRLQNEECRFESCCMVSAMYILIGKILNPTSIKLARLSYVAVDL